MEYRKTALAFSLIDLIVKSSPNQVHQVLVSNGFEEELKYGMNGLMAQNILQGLYVGNPERFINIMIQIKPDYSRISPEEREKYKDIANRVNPSARTSDWYSVILDFIRPKNVSETGVETIEETTTGAYIAYIVIVLAIIGITYFMIKSVK